MEVTMSKKTNSAAIGGAILILAGILALIGQIIPDSFGELFGTFLLLGLGIVFLLAGILTRESGWFIPGGILTGLGAGVGLITSSLFSRLSGDEGGWFLLVFAAGWFLIPVMSILFTQEKHWWALIPGGIIGFVGLAVLFGGVFMNALEWFGYLWPIALIAAGLYILWRIRHPKDEESEPVEKTA
jgi:hypothetical protein